MSLKQVTRSIILWEYSFIYQLIRQDEILFLFWDSWVFLRPNTQSSKSADPMRNLLSAGRLCKREASSGARVQLERTDIFKTWIYWYVQCLEENKGSNRNAEGNGVSGSGSFRCSHRGCRCDRLLGEVEDPWCKFNIYISSDFPTSVDGPSQTDHKQASWATSSPSLTRSCSQTASSCQPPRPCQGRRQYQIGLEVPPEFCLPWH